MPGRVFTDDCNLSGDGLQDGHLFRLKIRWGRVREQERTQQPAMTVGHGNDGGGNHPLPEGALPGAVLARVIDELRRVGAMMFG